MLAYAFCFSHHHLLTVSVSEAARVEPKRHTHACVPGAEGLSQAASDSQPLSAAGVSEGGRPRCENAPLVQRF